MSGALRDLWKDRQAVRMREREGWAESNNVGWTHAEGSDSTRL